MNRPRRGADAASLGLPILAASVAAFGGLLTGGLLYYRDISLLHRPVRSLVRAAWGRGELPLLDPLSDGGRHLLANPNHRVLHPTALLDLVLSADLALALGTVLQVFLAGWGVALLLRRSGLDAAASRVGGLAFGLSGPLLSLGNLPNLLGGVAWVPWIVLAGMGAQSRPLRLLPAAMLLAAIPLLAGGVESTGTALAILGLLALAAAPRWRRLMVTGAIAAGGSLLAAVVMLPALLMLRGSERGMGFRPEQLYYWSLEPARFMEMVVPGLWGTPTDIAGWWAGERFDGGVPLILSAYLGVTVVILAAAGIIAGLRRAAVRDALPAMTRQLLAASLPVGGLLLFLALGRHNPLLALEGEAPVLGAMLRFPERLLPLVALPVALAAGAGWSFLAARARERGGLPDLCRWLWPVCLVPLLATLALTASGTVPMAGSLEGARAAAAAVRLAGSAAGAAAAAALLLACVWLAGRRHLGHAAGWCAAGVVGMDLLLAGLALNPTAEPVLLEERPAAAAFLGQAQGAPRQPRMVRDPEPPVRGEHVPPGVEVAWSRRSLAYRIPSEFGLAMMLQSDVDRSAPLGNAFLRMAWEAAAPEARERLADRSGAAWRLAFSDGGGGIPAAAVWSSRVFPLAPAVVIVPRPQAAERLSLVPRGTALGHLQEAGVLQQVMSAMAQPDRDPRQEVLLTGLQEDVDGGWQPGAGQLQVVADRPTFLEVKASLPGPGLLVVRDSFMAGWEATVNGDAATILRADLAWRAVVLPAGEHAVRLTFRQPGLMAGAGCSAGGVVLALGLQVMGWRRRQGDAL